MKAIVVWERGTTRNESMSVDDMLDGYVLFHQISPEKPVTVRVYISGLTDGKHGFHIHEKKIDMETECDDVKDCCSRLGGHFNVDQKWSAEYPLGTPHGEHTGDLCMNIEVEDGMADTSFVDTKISLFPGKNCVIGRSLVIHEDEDDMGKATYDEDDLETESKITGNAGDRIACGNIVKL